MIMSSMYNSEKKWCKITQQKEKIKINTALDKEIKASLPGCTVLLRFIKTVICNRQMASHHEKALKPFIHYSTLY